MLRSFVRVLLKDTASLAEEQEGGCCASAGYPGFHGIVCLQSTLACAILEPQK
jgi:hypothetical protein